MKTALNTQIKNYFNVYLAKRLFFNNKKDSKFYNNDILYMVLYGYLKAYCLYNKSLNHYVEKRD